MDLTWSNRLIPLLPSNVTLSVRSSTNDEAGTLTPSVPLSEYVRSLVDMTTGSFDIIVIDGMERITCSLNALPRLSSEG